MDTGIRKAIEKINLLAQDPDFMRRYEAREKEIADFNRSVSAARKEGFVLGLSRGGLSVVEISKKTGLSVEAIEKILKNNRY
jgi:hypothetical protein